MVEIAQCRVNVLEVPMITEEFCEQYSDGLAAGGVTESDDEEVFAQVTLAFGLSKKSSA